MFTHHEIENKKNKDDKSDQIIHMTVSRSIDHGAEFTNSVFEQTSSSAEM